MSTLSLDSADYKAKQHQMWDSVAAGWGRWWPTFERGAQMISDRMVELAAVSPGKRVLDLATGIGEPAITAGRAVGADGLVIATDLSEAMLAIGKKRAALSGLTNIDFRCLDAEGVDRLDDHFDAILCRWGLFFLPDLGNTLQRVRSVLVPGGRLVSAVWAEPKRVPALSLPMKVAGDILKRQPPPGPGVFSLSDPAALAERFTGAGFVKVHIEEMMITAEFASADEFTRFTRDVSAPVKMLMADQPPERQEEIWYAVTGAAERFAGPDGRISMPLTSIIAVAQ